MSATSMPNASQTPVALCAGCDRVSTSSFTPYWVMTEHKTARPPHDRMTAWAEPCGAARSARKNAIGLSA